MTSPILVTGGTGTLGRLVVPLLRDAGCDVRVLSRGRHQPGNGVQHVTGDLLTGAGVESAVAGVETVLHLAGGPKGDDEATRNLVRAASRAGVRHLVYISVIGADRVPLSWLRSKLDAERAIADSGLAWTTLRAAQFHNLVCTMVEKMAKLPVVPVPGDSGSSRSTPRDVAERLVELTLGEPAGLVPDLAGPRGVRPGRADPQLPAGTGQAPPDAAGPDAGEGRPGVPGRREPDARRRRRGRADLGELPGRTAACGPLTAHPAGRWAAAIGRRASRRHSFEDRRSDA